MSNKIKKTIKKKLDVLLETKGFEDMEVAFGVKEKSDNLSAAEKKQFGSMESIQDKESGVINLGDASVQPALNKVHKEDLKDAEEYYKMVLDRMRNFQSTKEEEPTQIGESVEIKRQNLSEGAFWDRLKDKFFDLKITLKSIGISVKEIPNLYRLLKSGDHEGYEKALKQLEKKINKIRFTHPRYDDVKKLLKVAIKGLKELEDLTYSYFEKDPSKFSKHQQDILLGNMKITDDGLTRGSDLYNIDESFTPPKVNRKDDQLEDEDVYDIEALGPGMLALKYDNEGTPVHKKFEERMEDMNGDDLTYKKLRAYSEKYLKHKYQKPEEYHQTPKVRVTNESVDENYSDVIKENIFKVKGSIKSKEQVLNLVSKLPSRVKVNETEFAVTDGENYFKLIWEGDSKDGEAIIIREKNTQLVNESIDKMKQLWNFKPSDNVDTKKNIKENRDDVFFKMMNKVRNK